MANKRHWISWHAFCRALPRFMNHNIFRHVSRYIFSWNCINSMAQGSCVAIWLQLLLAIRLGKTPTGWSWNLRPVCVMVLERRQNMKNTLKNISRQLIKQLFRALYGIFHNFGLPQWCFSKLIALYCGVKHVWQIVVTPKWERWDPDEDRRQETT